MELWNDVCRLVRGYKNQNIPESKVEELWMTVFMELGWSKIKGELIAQIEIPIGSSNKLRPDILLKIKDKSMLVVELKRPNHDSVVRYSEQLVSYMLQMRIKIGILICSDIQIYYDDPSDNKNPQKLLNIDFVDNNPQGVKLFDLLGKSSFSEEKLHQFCQDLLVEQKEIEQAVKIANEIVNSNEETETVFKDYLSKKFGRQIADHLMGLLSFKVEKKNLYKLPRTSIVEIVDGEGVKPPIEVIDYEKIVDGEGIQPPIGVTDDEKIGAKAKKLFGSSITNEKFSLVELNALCDARYSKLNFESGYPILLEITKDNSDSIRYDHKGRSRYWKEIFHGYGKKFYITSQWYERQDSYLQSYFNRLNNNLEIKIEKLEFDVDGVTYKIILEPDEMSKYPHLVNVSTGYIAKNQKGVCREFLKHYGFDIPMDADTFLTHDSIKLVHKILNNTPLTQKEMLIKNI